MVYAKHKRQFNRQPKNLSRSVKLDTKKDCNTIIRNYKRNKNAMEGDMRERMIIFYTNIKNSLNLKVKK